MFGRLFKKDPVKKAKRHIEKALKEIEDDYPDYASVEYEKAARLFLEVEDVEFAVKYFREAAYTALQADDHTRAAAMKTAAAEVLLIDRRFDEAGGLYSEASDHLFRARRVSQSGRAISLSILCYLAARSFDTAVNLLHKANKRLPGGKKTAPYAFAETCVAVLCHGEETPLSKIQRLASAVKASDAERQLVEFVVSCVDLALSTEVVLEWAGPEPSAVSVKVPLELELRYRCPEPVRVTAHRVSLSNNVTLTRGPVFSGEPLAEDSWLLEVIPVLSGSAVVGPFRLTLEGAHVLAHKVSNTIEFDVQHAPPALTLALEPQRISCGLNDEIVIDAVLGNEGDGPASGLELSIDLSDGLVLTLGSSKKTVEFLGSGERMRFQLYVRALAAGDQLVTVKVSSADGGPEVVQSSLVRVH